MGRPAQGTGLPSDFASDFARASVALEEAVRTLLASDWEEPARRRAHQLATALCDSAKIAGWKEAGGVLQALASLLALPLDEVLSIKPALREKFLELLELLKSVPRSATA